MTMTTNKQITIKPCPFCGGTATNTATNKDETATWVICNDCMAYGPTMNGTIAAVQAWNELSAEPLPHARLIVTPNRIAEAYDTQHAARLGLHHAAEDAIKARTAYESAKMFGLTTGTVQGKNETEREASARAAYPQQYLDMIETEQAERAAKCDFDLAGYEVEATRALLRLMEVTK